MYILGISAFYHDSAAAIIKDGKVLYAAEEERFTRIKHDNQFPFRAIASCLNKADISLSDLSYIAYYEKPLLKFERILETFVQTYPLSLKPFHEAAILTVDGVGEYQTTGLCYGEGHSITALKSINFPHSLGLLYSTFTAFLGFKINEDEYKVMGLAAYGKPVYAEKIYQIVNLRGDGSFNLDLNYFSFRESFQMWNKNFERMFGLPRLPHQRILKRHKDIAASIQRVTEKIYLKILTYLYNLTKCDTLCIGGGVALNALANGKIYQQTPFKKMYILGASGDSGASLGSALFTNYSILGKKKRNLITTLYLGSSYTNQEIESILKKYNLKHIKVRNDELLEEVASFLAKNRIIGWFQGSMEFGPRALGARSILANPQPSWMKERINEIKMREQFRPFAGSILQEYVYDYFEVPEQNHFSPFMNFCFRVHPEKRKKLSAIVHKDNTCRIQTVNEENGRFYKLIKKFYEITGIPCILNTSFNIKGEPIVENPQQAVGDFLRTRMDYLVIGDYIISKVTRKE